MKYKLLTLTAIVLASTTNVGMANNTRLDFAKCFNSVATMLIKETARDQELAEFIVPAEVNEVKVKSHVPYLQKSEMNQSPLETVFFYGAVGDIVFKYQESLGDRRGAIYLKHKANQVSIRAMKKAWKDKTFGEACRGALKRSKFLGVGSPELYTE